MESNAAEKAETENVNIEKVDIKHSDNDKSTVNSVVFEEPSMGELETNEVASKESEKCTEHHTESTENEEVFALKDLIETVAEQAVEEEHVLQNGVCENKDDVDINVQKDECEVVTEKYKDEQANKIVANDVSKKEELPEVATIFATAVITNSKSSQVTSADIGALSSILKSKDHLCRNISYLNYGNLRAFRLDNGNYEHSVQIEIDVKTSNLWESARSYIFHHLGRDVWTLNDDARISMIRIHQKR